MTGQFKHGYALLIGVTENQVSDWALPDVAKDITALEKVLTHPQRCAYPPDHVRVLTGSQATRNGIIDALEWLQAQLVADKHNNATAVIAYTGHGFRDSSSHYYLIPYDVKKGRIQSQGLPAEVFAEVVGRLTPRRLLVILDCCHAGGMSVKGKGGVSEGYVVSALSPSLLKLKSKSVNNVKELDALAEGHGRAVLSSSTGEQLSYIRPDRNMSVFTYHLIEALTGHAQPGEGATKVLISDVMGHVTRKVPESVQVMGGRQTPDFQVSGNFPVALLLGGKGLQEGQSAPNPLDLLPEIRNHTELRNSIVSAQGPGAIAAGAVAIGGKVQDAVIIAGRGKVKKSRG